LLNNTSSINYKCVYNIDAVRVTIKVIKGQTEQLWTNSDLSTVGAVAWSRGGSTFVALSDIVR